MTLREIHERCKARHFDHMTVNEQSGAPFDLCDACDMPWPCPDYQDAVAALAILDEAEWALDGWQNERIPSRIVADPEGCA